MTESDIENMILATLYEVWHISDGYCNLHGLCAQYHWDERTFRKVVERLENEGLIEGRGLVTHEIISRGIIYAEQNGIAPVELTQENERARTQLMEALGDIYDQNPDEETHYGQLARMLSIDEQVSSKNLHILRVLDHLEEECAGFYKPSHRGLDAIAHYRKRKALATEYQEISEMQPQPRGRAFQRLFAKIIEHQGWLQEEGVRTSNEEMDVIVYHGRDYFLVECKWAKDPVETEVIKKLYGTLGNRERIQGIVVSMSGFTAGAIKQVEDYANARMILLFGVLDIESLVFGKRRFEDLVNEKYKELITRRKVIWE